MLLLIAIKWLGSYKGKHARKIKNSKRVLKTLRNFDGNNIEARIFAYIRKIDPFVFEEMLLTCFKERGCKVVRNRRYTGDGGIDGKIWIDKQRIFLQAKRYSKHINAKDVEEFNLLVSKSISKGLFIHTGKTGDTARQHVDHSTIQIISGSSLVNLLTHKPINVFGQIL